MTQGKITLTLVLDWKTRRPVGREGMIMVANAPVLTYNEVRENEKMMSLIYLKRLNLEFGD